MSKYKYVASNGLIFGDEEDMENLSSYSKLGWHLKKVVCGFYVLEKGESQEIIYSYDQNSVKKNEFDDYKSIFELSGWQYITSSGNVHFFKTTNPKTEKIHSDLQLFANSYKPIMICSGIGTLLGLLLLVLTICFKIGIYMSAISGAIIGGCGVTLIGSYLRVHNKRFKILSLNFKQSVTCFAVGLILLFIKLILPSVLPDYLIKIISLFSTMFIIYGGIFMLFQYQVWRDLDK